MLSSQAQPHLFRALSGNNAVLFVGAGFSREAINRLGGTLPQAADLSRHLWTWAQLEGEFDGSPLSVVYQAALNSGRPLPGLRGLLEDLLLATEVPAWYDTIARVYWHRIYGTNVDNVVETVYKRTRGPMLEPISAPAADFSERDQFLTRIQYVKLHGSLPGDPRSLTFGTLDYAGRANAREDWWRHFVRDYTFHPTLFVGSELDEPLFWQAIESRGPRGGNPEERPQSYLVTPSISPARRRLLEPFNIEHIPAKANEFFTWLATAFPFPTGPEVLQAIAPDIAAVLATKAQTEPSRHALTEFLGHFQPVPIPSSPSARPKVYLHGAPPTWDDIGADLDAPREVNAQIVDHISPCFTASAAPLAIALLGEGGSGKSTIIRRVAFTLRTAGRTVFFCDSTTRPDIQACVEALKVLNERVVLVIDNATLLGPVLADLIDRTARLKHPPIILFASRYIPFEQRIRDALPAGAFIEVEVPPLTDPDILALLSTLERNNQLGRLANLAPDARRYELKQRARKQILVAMKEATEGRGFDDIIASEFAELVEREHRILFLCAALGTAALVDLSPELWTECSELSSAETLRLLRRDLKGMLHETSRPDTVVARHPVIADHILDVLAGKEELMEAYRRVLLALAEDIYPGVGRKHRPWRLFVRLISHNAIFERFGSDIDHARGVFELTASAFVYDGHFWLQYANLEIDFGTAAFARPHMANAEGLLGDTPLVINTRAHMMLREALTVSSYREAKSLRSDAEILLSKQMASARDDDEYPFHVYLTHMLSWIRAWSPDGAQKKQDLEELLSTADTVCKRMPRNAKLRGVRDVIFRDYLGLAVTKP